MRRPILATALFATMTAAIIATFAVGATAQTTSGISVENVWARATTAAVQAGGVFATITDRGGPDRLIAASTPIADKAEVHETIRDGDVMKMRPVGGVAISAGAPLSLAPGGYHIMLTGLKQPLTAGESFPLSLMFEKAGTVQTTVTVRAVGHGAAMNMGQDMAHTGMPGMSKP